jgi:hypothetical protein
MFELNFRDDRYLPFEGAMCIRTGRCACRRRTAVRSTTTPSPMSSCICATRRDGGSAASVPPEASTRGQFLISLRHDFPLTWRALERAEGHRATAEAVEGIVPLRERDATVTTGTVRTWFEPATHADALATSHTVEGQAGVPIGSDRPAGSVGLVR